MGREPGRFDDRNRMEKVQYVGERTRKREKKGRMGEAGNEYGIKLNDILYRGMKVELTTGCCNDQGQRGYTGWLRRPGP
jgi:hypothetical protein